jgi:hypothetical protein
VRHIFPLLAFALAGCAPLFNLEGDARVDAAALKAEALVVYAKTYSTRHDDNKLESLDALATYSDDGEKALLDPWGRRFQFKYVTDPETESE